jgi:hypothetical protein
VNNFKNSDEFSKAVLNEFVDGRDLAVEKRYAATLLMTPPPPDSRLREDSTGGGTANTMTLDERDGEVV